MKIVLNEVGKKFEREWIFKNLSLELNSSDKRNCLYCYKEMAKQGLDGAHYIDDEDLFLTHQGINFARQNLL